MRNLLKKAVLATATVAALALAVSCSSSEPAHLRLLVGTYTANSGSLGVYLYDLDTETLEATLLDTAAAGNPSFVITDGSNAYSVSEFSDGTQGLYSYSLGDSTIDVSCFQGGSGGDPCNLLIAGGHLLSSDYTGGTLSIFPLGEDGVTGPIASRFDPRTLTPDSPQWHIHCAALSPDGEFVFVTDLGADAIYRCKVSDLPKAEFSTAFRYDPQMHPGPRHLCFSADGKFAYLLGETGDFLTTFAYSGGELTQLQTIKAYDGNGCGSADIHIGPDGRFLYTSHRLKDDGIAVFALDPESGLPEKRGYCPTGSHPRNFAITPDGKLLLCACRDSDCIEIYRIDPATGELTQTGNGLSLPSPVCVQILK